MQQTECGYHATLIFDPYNLFIIHLELIQLREIANMHTSCGLALPWSQQQYIYFPIEKIPSCAFSPTISKFWRYILRFVYLHYVHKEDITSGKKYKIKDSRTLIYIRLLRLLLFTISLLNIEYISLRIEILSLSLHCTRCICIA